MQQAFAQISDPHLSSLEGIGVGELLSKRMLGYLSWRRKRRFEHRPEVLAALQEDLRGQELDQVLITGDLTHIGLPSEFRQARDWLEQLGEPTRVALVPGNHDACVRTDWDETFALWQDYMAPDAGITSHPATANDARLFPSLRIRGDIAFIGISTACPTLPLMASGTAGAGQLARLPALLDDCAAKGLFRVIYLHHSPLQGQEKWRKRLTDASALETLLIEHGAELVLHGHGHRTRFQELDSRSGSIPVLATPSASALGLHGADIAHYNRFRVEPNESGWRLQIDYRRFDPASGSFIAGGERIIELSRPSRA